MNIRSFLAKFEGHPNKKSYKFKLIKIQFSRLVLSTILRKTGVLKCEYCPNTNLRIQWDNKQIASNKKATLDHVVPVSKGGKHFDLDNIKVCCESCNSKKSNKDLDAFLSLKK